MIITEITEDNISKINPTCFLKTDNEGCLAKLKWLDARMKEGMKTVLLYPDDGKKYCGFIEYVPGEFAWRPVEAKGYMLIHCMWVTPNKIKNKGNGSLLIRKCEDDAKKAGMNGVAAVVSEGSFMAGRELFEKNGYKTAEKKGKFEIMVKNFKKAALPKFKDTEKNAQALKGFNIIFSAQCPWVVRSIKGITAIAKSAGLNPKVTELKTAKKAQQAPSIYGTFTVVNDGKILADHYVSDTRFKNIVKSVGKKKK